MFKIYSYSIGSCAKKKQTKKKQQFRSKNSK